MSNTNCVANSSSIEYDLSRLPFDITGKGAFEAVFLNSVLDKLRGTCLNSNRVFIKQQCKSLYPDVNSKNWCRWLTSVDQENRISLTHTLERGKVPILYNTPRMCDPGISMSKNWSLRNYIESRLYLFKYVYGYGNEYTQNLNGSGNCGNNKKPGSSCYPSVVFDFRPYRYALQMGNKMLWVTQWITVPDPLGKERTPAAGFVPHTSITNYPHSPSKKVISSRGVFKSLVEAVIRGKNLGNDPKSLLNNKYELGAAGSRINNNNLYINKFIEFIEKYDRAKFAGENNLLIPNARNSVDQVINLTDDVLRVIFYDLVHDSVVDKNKYEEFKKKFIEEFNDPEFGFETSGGTGRIVEYKTWVGAGAASKSFKRYGTILSPTKGRTTNGKIVAVHNTDKQYPALFKTLGDLSQFMYAAKYNTMVGSGDKMGIALGLYVNAKNRKIIKCMMEDAVYGFIIYTGMKDGDLQFISKTGCGGPRNRASVCYGRVGQSINTDTLQKQIIDSLNSNEKKLAEQIKQSRVNRVKKQIQTNAKLAGASQNRVRTRATNPITRRNALIAKLNKARQNANKIIKTPPNTQPSSSAMNLNNSAKRRNSLNRYITNLNSQLEQHSIPNRLNKTVYMNNLAKSNTDNNLKRIKQKALNNLRLVAVKNGFKKTMRTLPYYSNLTNNNKNMLNGLIKGAPSINKLVTNIGPFINNTAKNRQAQKRGRNNNGSRNGNGNGNGRNAKRSRE